MSGLAEALAIAFGSAAYLAGWLLTARVLYAAWRPSRVPLCKGPSHSSRADAHYNPRNHGDACYRRRKPDGTVSEVSSDNEAAGDALTVSLLWPLIAAGLLIRRGAPQLQEEKDAHIRDLEAANDRFRAELDAGELE